MFNTALQVPSSLFFKLLKKKDFYILLIFNFNICYYCLLHVNVFYLLLLDIKEQLYLSLSSGSSFLLKRALNYLTPVLFFSLFGYYLEYEIRGRNLKVFIVGSRLFFILGLSHITSYDLPHSIQCRFLSKKLTSFVFFSYSLHALYQLAFFFSKMRRLDVYKGKGIFVKDFKLKLKIGKKKDF